MELIEVFKSFTKRSGWNLVTDSDKDKCAFIFNRYLSKKYPEKSILLNRKGMDKVSIMNLWFSFMGKEPYPDWFWSKSAKDKTEIEDKDFKLLMLKLNLNKSEDLLYLINNHPDFIKEELKFFKKSEKG